MLNLIIYVAFQNQKMSNIVYREKPNIMNENGILTKTKPVQLCDLIKLYHLIFN